MASDKKRGLGKGIGSLLGGFDFDAPAAEPKSVAQPAVAEKPADDELSAADRLSAIYVSIENISANPNQPRKAFAEESLNELAVSVKEQGIIQPIIVEEIVPGKYSIIAGERRFRAAKIAGLDKIPVIIRNIPEKQRIQMSLVENIQRENLNPIEEATAYQYLVQRTGMSQDEVADIVGKSRSAVANAIRLLSLPDDIKDDLVSGMMSAGHARAILSLVNPSDRIILRNEIIDKELSVRKAEARAEELNQGKKVVKAKPVDDEDPRVAEVSDKFVSALGAKCQITGGLKKGKLVIRYRSEKDLAHIYQRITGEDLFDE